MQFLVVARDGTDAGASERRRRCRPDHLAAMTRLQAEGNVILGGALLDDQGRMIGSAIVFEFPDRGQLDQYLARDPYVLGQVWQQVEVHSFNVATPRPAQDIRVL